MAGESAEDGSWNFSLSRIKNKNLLHENIDEPSDDDDDQEEEEDNDDEDHEVQCKSSCADLKHIVSEKAIECCELASHPRPTTHALLRSTDEENLRIPYIQAHCDKLILESHRKIANMTPDLITTVKVLQTDV
ncbi:hypothetical protein J6590_060745 [Homalodisca vitripennis]|nr:hypothetical protein J6590_060745 [Homalodisca vitripennis]